ncbi:hypothetical protein OGAPHI_007201 [Ogataea philodendri]|uniref:Amino acid permease/ SLC12A domain-containing protein n=1 Tax=Ogataea philodendri TaxID=1378263 RepID=A0A9P8NVI3_9ASCO|nr:uncharacterized protein OGAPHI_007201 [Ogataea philodendri]KAH3659996.1 hypothetical protein OGAPHI_007201 [Ogataea philodendri]
MLKQDEEKFPIEQTFSDHSVGAIEETSKGGWSNFIDSFKPLPQIEVDPNLSDIEKANILSAKSPLQRSLKSRHIQMISIGGAIGTGLFVGSGSALSSGGPASLLIAYFITGIMIFCTVHALGELAVTFPVSGSFNQYNSRFVSPSWGFAMAWNYVMQWIVTLPLELVAASITIKFWNSKINSAAWVSIFYVLIVGINFFGVKGYGEAEFIFSLIKVIAVVGFIILSVILVSGGGPSHEVIGARYWHDPGPFHSGFKGLCTVFVTAAFSFSGTELCGLTAAETENPRKTLPRATKQVFWRITLFYLVSLTMVGFLVGYNDDRLLGSSSVDIASSPFVIAIRDNGIKVLPTIMNVVILVAVLSVGNSAVFASSRTIASLAQQGFGPKWFGYIDRAGRPLVGVGITLLVGLLCFLAASSKQDEVFTWLMALSGLSSIFTWGSICFCHIRFRRALAVKGRGTDELPFTSGAGIWGSYFGTLLNSLVLVSQFWIALFPVGEPPNAKVFFEAYLTVPVVIFLYLFHVIWKRKQFVLFFRAKDIDVDTGRRETDIEVLKAEIAEEKAYIKSRSIFFRFYKFWC